MTGLSVVITTFNRLELVKKALESVIREFPPDPEAEIVLVDDASTDGTVQFIKKNFAEFISAGYLRVRPLPINVGVTGAKNIGYETAKFSWVIFLDSDDQFIRGSGREIVKELERNKTSPIVFFRCVDEQGQIVGRPFNSNQILSIQRYLKASSYGEALVAIQKSIVKEVPYDKDLRGYEGLGCCRIIKRYGPAILSTVIARVYDTAGKDRLSVSRGFLRRLPLLAKGHRIMASEFKEYLDLKQRLALHVKSCFYGLGGRFYERWENLKAE